MTNDSRIKRHHAAGHASITHNSLKPGLLLAATSVIAAGALFWFGAWVPLHNEYRQHVAQSAAAIISKSVATAADKLALQAEINAKTPALANAVRSNRPDIRQAAEHHLPAREGLTSTWLTPLRQAPLGDSLPPQVLDMIGRAERNVPPIPEIYKSGDSWLFYSVIALREATHAPIIGTLTQAYDLQPLTEQLASLPPEVGTFRLSQRVWNDPEQVIFTQGHSASPDTYTLAVGDNHLSLSFSPGALYQFAYPRQQLVLMALAALLALVGAMAGVYLCFRRSQMLINNGCGIGTAPRHELSSQNAVQAPGMTPLVSPQDLSRQEPPQAMSNPARVAPIFPDSIFRAYDIRGVVPKTLTAETAYWIGRAIGAQSLAQDEPNVSVGRDGRLSGPELVEQLIQGLADSGCHVSDVGLVPTPALYYAANVLAGKSGVMLTGSHNPSDYNGFKIVIAGDTLANEQIQALHDRLKNNDLTSGKGTVTKVDILQRYSDEITGDVKLARRLKVVVDCGNGAAGVIAPQLLEALNCEVIPLFCEVDGNFPNHHPDPGKPENLVDLIAKVKETGADVGLAFDGDGDRVGVVTETGEIVFPDRLLMLFARDVVARNANAEIIFDVKCTRRLTPLIKEYGGRPLMWKTGHSLIKKKMKETGALLAGEMSGHVFFKERWFGFDDGIYSAARLLEILSKEKSTAEELFQTFPNDISTPEINIHVTEESKFSIIDALHDAQWGEGANLTTIDGVRVDYAKGWGLVRASNTTPVLVLRFEADTEAELQRIKDVFHAQLKRVAPDLQLPF
ncbi:phosphomannomutase/phosphoglucomutase [Pseudomonas sp. CYM-20-01]|uniref:phosphomannomutase/phosphoglucomutase n=1 Tax=Pseudomonas sp. CYM-20-01 TaxID=2870750 RepID=UPI0020BFD228|nr:phosphomannomutase/phosphoglucomutase [Pseudomonas sp. CYM-20-01]